MECLGIGNKCLSSVANYNFDKSKQCIGAMTIEIDFLQKKSTDSSPYDSDKMAGEFIQKFNSQGFSVTQQVYLLSSVFDSDMWCAFVFVSQKQFLCRSPLSWSSVSATNSSDWLSKTSRRWIPASSKAKRPLERNRRRYAPT